MCIFLQIEKKKPKASIKWLKEPSERGGGQLHGLMVLYNEYKEDLKILKKLNWP